MSEPLAIAFDNLEARLLNPTLEQASDIRDLLTFDVPGGIYSKAFRNGTWDAKKRLLNRWGGFPTGWLGVVVKTMKDQGHAVQVQDDRPQVATPKADIELAGITLYDFQAQAVEQAIKNTRGIIQATTGSGKTEMGIALAGRILAPYVGGQPVRGIWLTNTKILLHQTRDRFTKRLPGLPVGTIGDGVRQPGLLTVATVQTLANWVEKGNPIFEGAVLLVLDEAHLGNATTWQAVIQACPNAYYKVGLTATVGLRDELANALLRGVTGGLIFKITARTLIDRGLLAEPHIDFLRVNAPDLPKFIDWQTAYTDGVVKNYDRNLMVLKRALRYTRQGLSPLVLVNRVDHGKILAKVASQACKAVFISGASKLEKRQAAINALAAGELDMLISSGIMDTGIDVPQIKSMVLAGGGMSSVKTFQRIGRGMRVAEGKTTVQITDFVDCHHRHLMKHSLQRLEDCWGEDGYVMVNAPTVDEAKGWK